METRPVVRQVNRRTGALPDPPRVQRYRAGRIPDYATEKDLLSSSASEAEDVAKPADPQSSSSSSSDDEESEAAKTPFDLSAIFASVHQPVVQEFAESSDEEDDEDHQPTVVHAPAAASEEVPANKRGLGQDRTESLAPIRKRLKLKARAPA